MSLGGGNMAKAIIGGLISTGYPATNIYVSEPIQEVCDKLKTTYGVHVTTDNNTALSFANHPSNSPADVVVIAVKPQVLKGVAEGIAVASQKFKPLFITIVAGIRVADFARWLSSDPATHALLPGAQDPSIVRVMPNTPALVQEGATGLWAPESVTAQQKELAFEILSSFSKKAFWLETEYLLDVVTGVSGMWLNLR
jgi:pyrroline-5-carboxylate reductase